MDRYRNRQEAGKILANYLQAYAKRDDVIVLALPRGGVPVAFEIAKLLHAPLDVFIVRKLGVPGYSELAMGAIAMGGAQVFNDDVVQEFNVSPDEIKLVIANEQAELARREKAYRDNQPFPVLTNKTVILVDDGIATGATMRAAVKALRQLHPAKIIVAVPVADKTMCENLSSHVDLIICPLIPTHLHAVGVWYEDFSQTEDAEVYTLLNEARRSLK